MIVGEHAVIRTADVDDAPLLWRLYDTRRPRSFLLGPAREILIPSRDELQEILSRKDKLAGTFFVVENREGEIQGCCTLRGAMRGAFYNEVTLSLVHEADYATPLADEVMEFLKHMGFMERKLLKIVSHCLDRETEYRAFLVRHGFESDGVQRDMVYTLGRYYNLESLSLFREDGVDAAGESVPVGEEA
ncbi:MAG: GNAT family N-acetyltransferase [bacterium]|nr:GNAT family N-acetyltransferase [bacterium]